MKIFFTIFLLTLSLSGCDSAGQSPNKPQLNSNSDSKATLTFVWAEKGVSFTLAPDWRRDDDGEDDEERSWIGPGNSKFSVLVHIYKPEYGNRSIEDETNSFYEDHKRSGGDEDLRYLEIDGVRGVHYLREEQAWDQDYQRQNKTFIVWNAQRTFKGSRYVINVTLSTSSRNFVRDRANLYSVLQSIKFSSS